jgi:hypothetical protein
MKLLLLDGNRHTESYWRYACFYPSIDNHRSVGDNSQIRHANYNE